MGTDNVRNALFSVARILSILVTIAWAVLVALVVDAYRGEFPLEALISFTPLSIACLALIGGWRWPCIGGWMAVVASVVFVLRETFFSGLGGFNLAVGLPFALNGLHFVVAGKARAGKPRLARWQAWAIGVMFATPSVTLIAFVTYAVWVMNQAFSNGFSPP